MARFFLDHKETLPQSLTFLNQHYQPLTHAYPKLQKVYPSLFSDIYICRNPGPSPNPNLRSQQRDTPISYTVELNTLLQQNVIYLIEAGRMNYVQTFGAQYKREQGGKLQEKQFNFAKQLLVSSDFQKLVGCIGSHQVEDLLFNFTVILKYKASFVQVLGPALFGQFNFRPIGEKKKQNGIQPSVPVGLNNNSCTGNSSKRSQFDRVDKKVEPFNRHQIYYCTHMGRHAGVFRKNVLVASRQGNGINPLQQQKQYLKTLVSVLSLSSQETKNFESIFWKYVLSVKQLFNIPVSCVDRRESQFSRHLSSICPLPKTYRILKKKVDSFQRHSGDSEQLFDQLYKGKTEYHQVTLLLKKCLNIVLPRELLGENNTEIFLKHVKQFVEMKRFENQKAEDICQNMNIGETKWLRINSMHGNSRERRNRLKNGNQISRAKRILSMLVNSVYLEFIIPVIKYNFYITQQHKQANKTFYYRKPIWTLISKLALVRFSQQNLEEIVVPHKEDKNMNPLNGDGLSSSYLNYPLGKLRIMPKKGSFRPIITFNRKTISKDFSANASTNNFKQNLNQMLSEAQLVLRNFKQILGTRFGNCVFDNRQIAEKYDEFYKKWNTQGRPQLSFFTLDIKKCYDSIDPQKLLNMLKESDLFHFSYLIVKYVKIYRNKKPLSTKKAMTYYFNVKETAKAVPLQEDHLQVTPTQTAVANSDSSIPTINVFLPRFKLITREKILQLLEHICSASVVSYQNRLWIQKFGIPQGLNVSGVLCSLYFAYLQSQFVKIEHGLLMRLTDDYLYLGPRQEAQRILDSLFKCASQNRFTFNSEKMKINFSNRFTDILQQGNDCTWIGKTFNLLTLQMYPIQDLDQIKKLKYSMNVNIPKSNSHCFLKNKLKSLLTNHLAGYLKPHLLSQESCIKMIQLYCRISFSKFFCFIEKYFWQSRAQNKGIPESLDIMCSAICISLRQFIHFACYLTCQVVQERLQYQYEVFMLAAVQTLQEFFKSKRVCGPEFRELEVFFKKRVFNFSRKVKNRLEQKQKESIIEAQS